jgi:hypothetical protein
VKATADGGRCLHGARGYLLTGAPARWRRRSQRAGATAAAISDGRKSQNGQRPCRRTRHDDHATSAGRAHGEAPDCWSWRHQPPTRRRHVPVEGAVARGARSAIGGDNTVTGGHHRTAGDAHQRAPLGLATIPVRVDDARVSTDETLLEAASSRTPPRRHDRPRGSSRPPAVGGALRLTDQGRQTPRHPQAPGHRPQATISSELSLLKLSPELHKDLVTGVRRVEHVRNPGQAPRPSRGRRRTSALPRTVSGLGSRRRIHRCQLAHRTARESRPALGSRGWNYHAVIIPLGCRRGRSIRSRGKRASDAFSHRGPTPPKRRRGNAQPTGQQARRFPHEDGVTAAQYQMHKMPPDEFSKMLDPRQAQGQADHRAG